MAIVGERQGMSCLSVVFNYDPDSYRPNNDNVSFIYSFMNSTRRLLALPSAVVFLSTG